MLVKENLMDATTVLEPKATDQEKSIIEKSPQTNGRNGAGHPVRQAIPMLENGDHLTRIEFERRYQAYPEIKKAELIEGVVFVASPVKVQGHGEPHAAIVTWLGVYRFATRGVRFADNSTYLLDNDNEPQPDVTLWIDQKAGGQAVVTHEDYLEGIPELVVEVAGSSATIDLRQKLRAYRRKGVKEYIVLLVHERQTHWFSWQDGEYVPIEADAQGVLKSHVFPGLWLHSESFWTEDLLTMLKILQQGISSPEHQAFVTQLTTSDQ